MIGEDGTNQDSQPASINRLQRSTSSPYIKKFSSRRPISSNADAFNIIADPDRHSTFVGWDGAVLYGRYGCGWLPKIFPTQGNNRYNAERGVGRDLIL